MNDTSEAFRTLTRRTMLARSPQDRVMMGVSMHESARAMVLASLPSDATECQRRHGLFLRFYGRDFGEAAKLAIKQAMGC